MPETNPQSLFALCFAGVIVALHQLRHVIRPSRQPTAHEPVPALFSEEILMASTRQATVLGVFQDRARAEEAVHALRKAGFTDKQIGLVSRGKEG